MHDCAVSCTSLLLCLVFTFHLAAGRSSSSAMTSAATMSATQTIPLSSVSTTVQISRNPTGTTLTTSSRPSSYNPTEPFFSGTAPSGAEPTPTGICYAVNGVCRGKDASSDGSSYYFVFIAIFFVLVAVILWISNQRRRRRLAQNTDVRRSALERDMRNSHLDQLYANTGRVSEGRRPHARGTSGPFAVRRDEGLDERGEAPPPYKRDSGDRSTDDAGLAIPMQTFQRDERHAKPPEYDVSAYEAASRRTDDGPSNSGTAQASQPLAQNTTEEAEA